MIEIVQFTPNVEQERLSAVHQWYEDNSSFMENMALISDAAKMNNIDFSLIRNGFYFPVLPGARDYVLFYLMRFSDRSNLISLNIEVRHGSFEVLESSFEWSELAIFVIENIKENPLIQSIGISPSVNSFIDAEAEISESIFHSWPKTK